MGDGVGFTDIGEEFVAEALAFRGACYQTGDVDEFDNRRLHFLRFDDIDQRLHARVGHFDDTDVGFDGAERVVFRCDACTGNGIEQGGFTHVWQADDSTLHVVLYS